MATETSFAALLFRTDEVSDRALSRGFAVALAGWDVPGPHLLVAELPGIPGFSAAFYRSGLRGGFTEQDELEHASELFESELPPAVGVLDAVAEAGRLDAVVYGLVFSEDMLHDDGWVFGAEGVTRRFVREGEEGLEHGEETAEGDEVTRVEVELPEGASDDEERAAIERAVREHRGSALLARELGAPVLGALMAALFAPERRVEVRLVPPDAGSIAEETRRLGGALRRVPGRGAFEPPAEVAGVPAPDVYRAFVAAYDWADPSDPGDLYRELAIGAVEGTLRFLRAEELAARGADPAWAQHAAAGLFPVASLRGSALGGGRAGEKTIALGGDDERLIVAEPRGARRAAGPTFGELLAYLALGFSSRTEEEEEVIGALMLRARVVVDREHES